MPQDTPDRLLLPERVRLLRWEAEDATDDCVSVCADPDSTDEDRRTAVAVRFRASDNYAIWRDVLKEMD